MEERRRRLQQLRLRDLRLLEAIDAHGTLQAVARALFVTQPAISQALRSLEDSVGVPLAARSRRGVELTEAGRTLRVHLMAADASLAAGLEAIAVTPARPVLRLGAIPYALIDALPAAIARLGDASFSLHVVTGAVEALAGALRRGEVDAVLAARMVGTAETAGGPASGAAGGRARAAAGARAPEAIRAVPVATIRNAIACGHDHPLARRRDPPLAELARADWVLPGADTNARAALDALFLRAGLAPPVPRIESGSFADNLRFAAAARALTLAPADVIERARPAMRVLRAPPEWAARVTLSCLAHRAGWPPLEALRAAFAAAATGRAPRRSKAPAAGARAVRDPP
jgi:DNA-binding transcriptional LysR family regulator